MKDYNVRVGVGRRSIASLFCHHHPGPWFFLLWMLMLPARQSEYSEPLIAEASVSFLSRIAVKTFEYLEVHTGSYWNLIKIVQLRRCS